MNKQTKEIQQTNAGENNLFVNSIKLIHFARSIIVKQVNTIQLLTNYSLGRWIVEEEQNGLDRAGYGKHILAVLSQKLSEEFGRGFSVDTLENARKFYLTYKGRISETLFRKFAVEKSESVLQILDSDIPFKLSWSHYLILMRIETTEERNFYEIESFKSLSQIFE